MKLRAAKLCLAVCLGLAYLAAPACAGQREDFLAGRTRDCPRCELAGVNLKRRDLAGADLTGADLKQATLHDAKLTNQSLI
jgi:uncharacterized protein YjbI with pentapeptide repeats